MDKLKSIGKIIGRLFFGLSIVCATLLIIWILTYTAQLFLILTIISFIPLFLISYVIGDMIMYTIKNNKKVG